MYIEAEGLKVLFDTGYSDPSSETHSD